MQLVEPDIETIKKISTFILNRESDELRKELYDFLVILSLSEDKNGDGLSFSSIINSIKKELKLNNIPENMVKESLERLLLKDVIYEHKRTENYVLSDEYRRRMTRYNEEYDAMILKIHDNLRNKLKESISDITEDLINKVIVIFENYLASVFSLMSIESCSAIIKLKEGKIETNYNALKILNDILQKLDDKSKTIQIKEVIISYIHNPDENLKNYLFSLAQTYFAIEILQLDPDCNIYTKQSLKEKIIYLDTNVIYHSLIKTDKRSEATNNALQLTKKLEININFTKETKKEYEKLINHKKNDLNKIKLIPKTRYDKISEELEIGITKDYFESKKKNNKLTVDSYFSRLEEYETILSSLFNVKLDESAYSDIFLLPNFDDAKKCVLTAAEEFYLLKSNTTATHDAFHILLIQDLRQKNLSDILGPKYWFLTNDNSLDNAEDCIGNSLKSNIKCSTWIQIITPFLSPIQDKNVREAFTTLFASKLPLVSDLIDENDFLMLQGTWIDNEGLSGKDVARIIGNQYVRKYLRKIKDENVPITEAELSNAINPLIDEIKRSKSENITIQNKILKLEDKATLLENQLKSYKDFTINIKYVISIITCLVVFLLMYFIVLYDNTNKLLGSIIIGIIIGYLLGFPGYKFLLEKVISQPFYQFLLIYKSGADFLYAYELNLSKNQAIEIARQIDTMVPSIRFEDKLIYPKRVNQYRIYKTKNSFKQTSLQLHELYPEGYEEDFGGEKVRLTSLDTVIADTRKRLKSKQVRAFLSASFSDDIDEIISWFTEKCTSLDINIIWLKDKYQARPTEDKIKENIKLGNCFIQIITKEVFEKGKEAGWIGNEIAWAKESTPNGNMAIFVEEGCEATGLASVVADKLYFNPKDLKKSEEKIIQYLSDLKGRVMK